MGVSWVSMMLLWFTRRITTYWYHYLTPWGIALVLLAGVVARLERRYPKGVLSFVLVVAAVFIYFAPVWAELPDLALCGAPPAHLPSVALERIRTCSWQKGRPS